jgi:hypothetical protein
MQVLLCFKRLHLSRVQAGKYCFMTEVHVGDDIQLRKATFCSGANRSRF